MDKSITLIVVPTAGNIRLPSGRLEPSDRAKLRLTKALELLRDDPNARLAIVGGLRDDPDNSEAQVAMQWLDCQDPFVINNRLAILDASAKFTAHDMRALAEHINRFPSASFDLIILVTHPDHAWLARRSLMHRLEQLHHRAEVECWGSGEPAPYPPLIQGLLDRVTRADPLWERPWWKSPTTALLRWKANQRDDPPAKLQLRS